jgi:hypothetical protein
VHCVNDKVRAAGDTGDAAIFFMERYFPEEMYLFSDTSGIDFAMPVDNKPENLLRVHAALGEDARVGILANRLLRQTNQRNRAPSTGLAVPASVRG